MSASLKLHCAVLKCLRQANPTEDHRRQRTFAWALASVILTENASLGQCQRGGEPSASREHVATAVAADEQYPRGRRQLIRAVHSRESEGLERS